MVPTKICPDCGSEYRFTAERCTDCGTLLVHPEASVAVDLPPAAELRGLVREGPWELERIAEALSREGIPSRIDTYPPSEGIRGSGFRYEGHAGHGVDLCLYVRDEDHPAAEDALEAYRAESLPGAHAPSDVGAELAACPACGTPIATGANRCGDCGLVFSDEGLACLDCGAAVTSDDVRCRACGADLGEDDGRPA